MSRQQSLKFIEVHEVIKKGQDMKCSAKNCSNDTKTLREGHGITFHKFPRDPGPRKSWTEVLGMFENPEVNSEVCSDHFRSEDIYVTRHGLPRIRDGALPVVVQVCRICLATDVKMYSIRDRDLRRAYADVCGIIITDSEEEMKQKLRCFFSFKCHGHNVKLKVENGPVGSLWALQTQTKDNLSKPYDVLRMA